MSRARSALFFRCFLRSYLVGAAYNPRGLQNIGFLYVIEPALVELHGAGEHLRQARLRYATRYNCHPFFTPLFLGVLLHLESAVARGTPFALPPALKDTTANALSAIGDSFFNGSVLATWALASACLILADLPGEALWLTMFCLILLQIFKVASFVLGLRKGMSVLLWLRELDLINWGDYFKSLNAVLLTLFLWQAMPDMPPPAWASTLLYLLAAGWLVGRLHMGRTYIALLLVGATAALHLSGMWMYLPVLPELW